MVKVDSQIVTWLRLRWSVLLVGVFVVPLCANLLVGVPYQIYRERDLALHGQTVVGRAVAARQQRYKGGAVHSHVTVDYEVGGEPFSIDLATDGVAIGAPVSLRYAPASPGYARLDVPPAAPWDADLARRLVITWSLGLLFGGVWLRLLWGGE